MAELLLLADSSDLLAARLQMAFTLGSHIILACFGVGLPLLMLVAEGLSLNGDTVWRELARRWSKSFAVLFAVGAVSGTVLSFELGLLWPEFMGVWGSVIGLPFTLEGFAFFVEAIFAGIYLYGWNRLPPKVHWLATITATLTVASVLFGWAWAQYPYVVIPNISIHAGDTPANVVWLTIWCIVGGLVVIAPPMAWLFYLFKTQPKFP